MSVKGTTVIQQPRGTISLSVAWCLVWNWTLELIFSDNRFLLLTFVLC